MKARMKDRFSGWTLFLDRDGVINQKAQEHHYITSVDDFVFLPNVLDAIRILSEVFRNIVVTTNQQGIAKGVFTQEKLFDIHSYMVHEIEKNGGRIDGIYFCPHLNGTCECRKPGIGLAVKAKSNLPSIDFSYSIVAGDSASDMEFAKNIGAVPILINNNRFDSLYDFALSFTEKHEIGVIAGAFDVIHPGYIKMFAESKDVCDHLIVLLHEDPSIQNPLKPRPVLSLLERKEILMSIKYVDEVLDYKTENDLAEIVNNLPHHVRILGGDYAGRSHTGNDFPVYYCRRSHSWSATRFKEIIIKTGLPQ